MACPIPSTQYPAMLPCSGLHSPGILKNFVCFFPTAPSLGPQEFCVSVQVLTLHHCYMIYNLAYRVPPKFIMGTCFITQHIWYPHLHPRLTMGQTTQRGSEKSPEIITVIIMWRRGRVMILLMISEFFLVFFDV